MLLFLTIAFFSLGTAFAQPDFTSSDMPNIGDSDTIIFIPDSQVQNNFDTETGNDYTWDFSHLPFATYASLNNVESYREKQHAMADYFPDATIERYSNGVSSEQLGYYQFRNDTLLMYRYGPPSSAGWFPPIALMAFPLEFNETSDIISPFYYGDLETGKRHAVVLYDGFGTLKMPDNKTHQNVFRVKRVETDTTYVTSSSITYISYLWYKQGGLIPLLEIRYDGTPGSYTYFGSKARGSQTGLLELRELKNVSIYPNPVNDQLNIELENSSDIIELKLMNSMGQLINVEQRFSKTIDVSDLPKGLYYLQIRTKEAMANKAFIRN